MSGQIEDRPTRRIDVDLAPGLTITVMTAEERDERVHWAAPPGPASIAAAARLATMVEPGQSVVDLGAGAGLVALAAAARGARALGLYPDAFTRAAVADAASRLQQRAGQPAQSAQQSAESADESSAAGPGQPEIREFDMRGEQPLPPADFVVMTDLLDDPELEEIAAHRVLEALSAGARVLVGDRADAERGRFDRILAAAGVRVVFGDMIVVVPGTRRPARCALALLGPLPDADGRDVSTEPMTRIPR